jgi:hypothetical protein
MDRLMDSATPQAIAPQQNGTARKSVAFTYNDPVIFAEYAMDTADACHAWASRPSPLPPATCTWRRHASSIRRWMPPTST